MTRIDLQTLIMVFEKRIEALEKNPPDKIPMHVIINLLERSIEESIKEIFLLSIEKELKQQIKSEFTEMKSDFINKTISNILTDDGFRRSLEDKIKGKLLNGWDSCC